MAVLKTFKDGCDDTLNIELGNSKSKCLIKITDEDSSCIYIADSEDLGELIIELQSIKKQIDNNIENSK